MCWRRSFPASESAGFFGRRSFRTEVKYLLAPCGGPEKALSNSFKGKRHETCILAEFWILLSFCMFLVGIKG